MAITDILTPTELDDLRAAYDAHPEEMATVLDSVNVHFPPVKPWLDAIGSTMFGELAPQQTPNLPLSPIDRERCLIAIIATRRETLNLAVHIYMGMMAGIQPAEVANILALTGVYTGISTFIRGCKVAQITFTTLKAAAALPSSGPLVVIGLFAKAFAGTWGD